VEGIPFSRLWVIGFDHLTAHHRCDLGPQQFDGQGHFVRGQTPDVDLSNEALVPE